MSLQDYFREQARWRREKAEEYPDDRRNPQSAAALESLAEYVEPDESGNSEADERVAAELEKHLAEFTLGGEETQRAVARYGFGYSANRWTHEAFLEELLVLCALDAYELVREGASDEDVTGTLLPFEEEAAQRGVMLPRAYFERCVKGRNTEGELRAWIEDHEREEAARLSQRGLGAR
jgi:hypothetical protein